MLISPTRRFIFFHVGKTGGMSIRAALMPYAQEPEKFKINRPPRTHGGRPNPLYSVWETLLWHATARDAQAALPAAIFADYYKFAFVRNPWDWHVSMYHFLLNKPTLWQYPVVKERGSFAGYVEWACSTAAPFPRGITRLQSEIITDSAGRLLVDYLGRFETLGADFLSVCAKLAISAPLPHMNQTSHSGYQTYYDERTKKLIADNFAQDIELGKYTFDGIRS